MDNQKLLSIVIPTYNRGTLLAFTLSLLREQVTRNEKDVELIVCDNVSTDDTLYQLGSLAADKGFFRIVKYSEHLKVGDSIVRSIENATGKFFVVWGDDDVPSPYMVDILISKIRKYPQIGKLVFNRLAARTEEDNFNMNSLELVGSGKYTEGEEYYDDFVDFASNHQTEQGFLSVQVVRRDLWVANYQEEYPNNHIGFEYLVPYMYSASNHPALYLQYPLCIQRRPSLSNKNGAHDFKDAVAFLYFTIGRPRTIKRQWELGLIRDFREAIYAYNYHNNNGSTSMKDRRCYFYDACVNWTTVLKPYTEELCEYQLDDKLKVMIRRLLGSVGISYKFWNIYYKIELNGFMSYIQRKFLKLLHLK